MPIYIFLKAYLICCISLSVNNKESKWPISQGFPNFLKSSIVSVPKLFFKKKNYRGKSMSKHLFQKSVERLVCLIYLRQLFSAARCKLYRMKFRTIGGFNHMSLDPRMVAYACWKSRCFPNVRSGRTFTTRGRRTPNADLCAAVYAPRGYLFRALRIRSAIPNITLGW